jgi:hypothetical protein
MSEQQIQRAIAAYLDVALPKDTFWTAINPVPGKTRFAASMSKAMGMKPGVPDILIVDPEDHIWLEVKKEGGYLSKVQKAVHERIKDAGGLLYTVRSIDDVSEILDELGLKK